MSKKEIHYMGILANTDSSILNVKLDHGFKIHALTEREGLTFISNLEKLPMEVYEMEIYKKLSTFCCFCHSDEKLYYIGNSIEINIEMNNEGMLTSPSKFSKIYEFDKNLVHDYLDSVIRLMRLFKEGNIYLPLQYYYYFVDNNIPKSFTRQETLRHISSEAYTLESSEIADLQEFVRNTKLPFKESFLQLALENFELSYQTHNMNLSFLSLMISLETLFNHDRQELRYRVSRNTAVLLGKEREDSKIIFSEIKDLYDKRSKIVHTGESNIINNEDLLKLRYYVRESIKEINKIGKSKNELLDLLNSCGFGERAWTK